MYESFKKHMFCIGLSLTFCCSHGGVLPRSARHRGCDGSRLAETTETTHTSPQDPEAGWGPSHRACDGQDMMRGHGLKMFEDV